jgi:hypothetical protein
MENALKLLATWLINDVDGVGGGWVIGQKYFFQKKYTWKGTWKA